MFTYIAKSRLDLKDDVTDLHDRNENSQKFCNDRARWNRMRSENIREICELIEMTERKGEGDACRMKT